MREAITTTGNETVVYDAELADAATATALFRESHAHTVAKDQRGRGTVRFLTVGNDQYVLRRYRRGGLVSKLVKATYFYSGLNRTRMIREFRLLGHLATLDLPAPRPIAIQIKRSGLTYQGALLTARLQGASTLAEIIEKDTLGEDRWERVGHCIAGFHQHGVFHADLNANNVMLDDNAVYLIDFDRGALRDPTGEAWRKSNLQRLHTSLCKIKRSAPSLQFDEAAWQQLISGYESARDTP